MSQPSATAGTQTDNGGIGSFCSFSLAILDVFFQCSSRELGLHAREVSCLVRGPGPLVFRHLRVRTKNARAHHFSRRHLVYRNRIRRLTLFDPARERAERIELVGTRAIAAMEHTGN